MVSIKKAGLDQQFIDTFEIALNFISEHPTLYQVQVRGLRAVLLSRFPYRVFYKVYSDHVMIFGVLHTKRSIKAITRRK